MRTTTQFIHWTAVLGALAAHAAGVGLEATQAAECRNYSLAIVDHDGATRDVWTGQDPTGANAVSDPRPEFSFEFNAAVDLTLLENALRLVGSVGSKAGQPAVCDGNQDPGVLPLPDIVSTQLASAGAAWGIQTVENTAQQYPRDFDAFVFGDVADIPHFQGALAAGGTVKLRRFFVNRHTRHPVGIVAGKGVDLAHGMVVGDVVYGATASVPASVRVTGQLRQASPISFSDAERRLTALSAHLSGLEANGEMARHKCRHEAAPSTAHPGRCQRGFGSLWLIGKNPGLNVFSLSASDLAGIFYLGVRVPEGSAALVNVAGASPVKLRSTWVHLRGIDAGDVLWNFYETPSLTLWGMRFPGSVLAPKAAVNLSNGNLEGTLVAKSLTGSGEFHTFPFARWEDLAVGGRITAQSRSDLWLGCPYQLTIDQVPLNAEGACLVAPVALPFHVTLPGGITAFDRETRDVRRDPHLGNVTAMDLKPEARVMPSELFVRYRTQFGVGPHDEMTLTIPARPTGSGDHKVSFYQQTHRDVPVLGYGMFVLEENGLALGANGRVMPGLDVAVTPSIGEDAARHAALEAFGAVSPYPWQVDSKLVEPSATLHLVATQANPGPADFRVAWLVRFIGTGVKAAEFAFVDAASGVVFVREGPQRFACPGYDPQTATNAGYIDTTISTWRFGQRTIPVLHQTYTDSQAGNATHDAYVLTHTEPDPYWTDTGAQDAHGPVCNLNNVWKTDNDADLVAYGSPANAVWSLRAAMSYIDGLGLKYGDQTWRGVDGEGKATLFLIVSADPSFGTGFPAYSSHDTSALVDPHVFLDPSYPLFVADHGLEHFTVAHEYAHGVFAAVEERRQPAVAPLTREGEAGSIVEGFVDSLAMLVMRSVGATQWAEGYSWRNFKNPHASQNPVWASSGYPDTVGDQYYFTRQLGDVCSYGEVDPDPARQAYPDNDRCGVHQNSTIVSHWFYLLVAGGEGENASGCHYRVVALGDDGDGTVTNEEQTQSGTMAAHILFRAAAEYLGGGVQTFANLADATREAATDLYGAQAAQRVLAAWRAVGVLKDDGWVSSGVYPPSGTVDYPANYSLRFATPGDGRWQLQVAENTSGQDCRDIAFPADNVTFQQTYDACVDNEAGVEGSCMRTNDGTNTKITVVYPKLNWDTSYCWRVRPESDAAWGDCEPVYSLRTKPRRVYVNLPRNQMGSDYVLDYWSGTMALYGDDVPLRINVTVSDQAAPSCSTSPTFVVEPERTLVNGECLSLVSFYRYAYHLRTVLEKAGIPIVVGQRYYLHAIAEYDDSRDGQADAQGQCTVIPVMWRDFAAPELKGPGQPSQNNVTFDLPHDSTGQEFRFTPVEKAASYYLRVYRWYPLCDMWVWMPTFSRNIAAGDPSLTLDPLTNQLVYTFQDTTPTTHAVLHMWTVEAIADDGYAAASAPYYYEIKLPAPTPMSPKDGAWIVVDGQTSQPHLESLEFSSVAQAGRYTVGMWPQCDDGWKGGVTSIQIADDGTSQPISAPTPVDVQRIYRNAVCSYCWQVAATNASGHDGQPSDPSCFQTFWGPENIDGDAYWCRVAVDAPSMRFWWDRVPGIEKYEVMLLGPAGELASEIFYANEATFTDRQGTSSSLCTDRSASCGDLVDVPSCRAGFVMVGAVAPDDNEAWSTRGNYSLTQLPSSTCSDTATPEAPTITGPVNALGQVLYAGEGDILNYYDAMDLPDFKLDGYTPRGVVISWQGVSDKDVTYEIWAAASSCPTGFSTCILKVTPSPIPVSGQSWQVVPAAIPGGECDSRDDPDYCHVVIFSVRAVKTCGGGTGTLRSGWAKPAVFIYAF